VGQVLRLYLLAGAALADLIVLAILAAQIAPGEKDGARSAAAHQGVFLAKVGAIAGDDGPLAGAAAGALGAQAAVDPALAGADVAGFQAGIGFGHPAL
jgi:hypothetical protein